MDTAQKNALLAALETNGQCRVRVEGSSMRPFIQSGDTITICAPLRRPALGMIVAIFVADQLIAHRIVWHKKVGRQSWELWIAGDAMPHSISCIASQDVVGMVACINRAGRPDKFWCKPPGSYAAVVFGAFIRIGIRMKRGTVRLMVSGRKS